MNKIFIITRREFEKHKGIGTYSSEIKLPIEKLNGLKMFWLDLLLERLIDTFLNECIGENIKSNDQSCNPNELVKDEKIKAKLNVYINTDFIKPYHKKITKNYILKDWKPKNELVNRLFDLLKVLDEEHILETEFLLNVSVLNQNIFVYHHWLDKQGFSSVSRKKFLLTLRNEILNYYKQLNKLAEDINVEVNWLVHDSDLGRSGTDGMVLFNNEIINENNPNYFELSDSFQSGNFVNDFKNNNFWIFTHSRGTGKYFDKIICAEENSQRLKNADELWKYLVCDLDNLHYRANVLDCMITNINNKSALDDEVFIDPIFVSFITQYNRALALKQITGDQINDLDSLIKAITSLIKK